MRISKVLFTSLMTVSFSTIASAQAVPLVRNPLYDLDPSICEIKQPPKLTQESSEADSSKSPAPKVFHVERISETYGKVATINDPGFLRVKREHLIQKLLVRYPVSLPYSKLIDPENDPKRLLVDSLAPCDPLFKVSQYIASEDYSEKKNKELQESHNEREQKMEAAYAKACKLETVYESDEIRFKDDKSALRFRRALLRLFESAETGTSRDFIAVRKPTPDFELPLGVVKPDRTKTIEKSYATFAPRTSPKNGQWSAEIYRPLVDARADDVMLRRFIFDIAPPFEVLCRGVKSKGDDKVPAAISAPARLVTEALPFVKNGFDVPVENAAKRKSEAAKLGDALNWIKKGYDSPKEREIIRASVKPSLVKSAQEFAKSSRDGAEISLANLAGDDNDTVTIDAAAGLTFTNIHGEKDGDLLQTFSVTPFVGISQAPTDFNFFKPEDDNGMISFSPEKKQIAFATLSAGIRFDYERQGPKITNGGDWRSGQNHASLVGQRWPGLRLGATVESLTDNYNFQKGERYTLDMSFPKYFTYAPGFRQRQELINREPVRSGESRTQNNLGPGRILTGWAVEWDVRPTLNILDWGPNGLPFNFETSLPRDRVAADALDDLLYGFDFELELLKANTFGGILGDNTIKLSLDYSYRDGYGKGIITNPEAALEEQITVLSNAERFKVGVEISHPDFSNLSLGFDYENGEDFSTFSKTETLNLKLKAKY